jgi:hypothetical protein
MLYVHLTVNKFCKLYQLTCLFVIGDKGRYMTNKTLEGRSPLCIVGNKLCFADRSGNNICVHENNKASSFKELGQIQVGL